MNNIRLCVVDTETAGSLQYPFIYNLAYVIADLNLDTGEIKTIAEKDFVIRQVWRNRELMQTAYYSTKRPLYTSLMKGKKAKMVDYGKALSAFKKDLDNNGVTDIWAFNCNFDNRAIHFNNEWYKKPRNYFNYNFRDIRAVAIAIADKEDYGNFCINNNFLTEKKHLIKTTAESFFAYITNNPNHIEKHLALSDTKEELDILAWCCSKNIQLVK